MIQINNHICVLFKIQPTHYFYISQHAFWALHIFWTTKVFISWKCKDLGAGKLLHSWIQPTVMQPCALLQFDWSKKTLVSTNLIYFLYFSLLHNIKKKKTIVCFKKIVTKCSSDILLRFVTVLLKQTLFTKNWQHSSLNKFASIFSDYLA